MIKPSFGSSVDNCCLTTRFATWHPERHDSSNSFIPSFLMHKGSRRVRLLTQIFLQGLLMVGSSSSVVIAADITSSSSPTGSDPVASLQRRLDQREVQLQY